jgi:hypothetical protein
VLKDDCREEGENFFISDKTQRKRRAATIEANIRAQALFFGTEWDRMDHKRSRKRLKTWWS